jgi:hypothetical protein
VCFACLLPKLAPNCVVELQPTMRKSPACGYLEVVHAFAAQDVDDFPTSYLLHFSIVSHWFPIHEGFVISLGSAVSGDAFNIIVARNKQPVFVLMINPSDTTHMSACHSCRRGLMSIERQHPRHRLAGVSVVGREWMLWSVGGTPSCLRRIGGWRQHLESEESFRVLSAHISVVKFSARLL